MTQEVLFQLGLGANRSQRVGSISERNERGTFLHSHMKESKKESETKTRRQLFCKRIPWHPRVPLAPEQPVKTHSAARNHNFTLAGAGFIFLKLLSHDWLSPAEPAFSMHKSPPDIISKQRTEYHRRTFGPRWSFLLLDLK